MRTGLVLRAALAALSCLNIAGAELTSSNTSFEESQEFCFQSCTAGVKSVKFTDIDSTAPPGPGFCRSELAGWSLMLCMRVYCDARQDQEERLRTLNETCAEMGRPLPSWEEVHGKWPQEKLDEVRRIWVEDKGEGMVLGEVAIPGERYFWLWAHTLASWEYVYYYHHAYGWAMGAFWVLVIAVGILARLSSSLNSSSSKESRFWKWYKANIFLPMAYGETSWASTPTREQAIVSGTFVFINVIVCCAGYRVFEGNMYYPSTMDQILRYVSDRTGIVSFANFPMIWLFGMRNNLVSYVTGWDFGACTVFHRWVARVAALQAVVHSVGYTVLVIREGGWASYFHWWTRTLWWAGELATVFMCGVVALSFYWVRKKHYETFLVSHIWLSALTIVTMLMHVSVFGGVYDPLANIPLAIWLIDRTMRVGKILLFNPRFWTTRADAMYDADANVVKLDIGLGSSKVRLKPGMFVYLMVLEDWRWWQSHPFTVAGVRPGGAMKEQIDMEESDEVGPLLQMVQSRDGRALEGEDGDRSQDVATVLIRPYDQFTGRLRDLVKNGKRRSLRVVVEGPYGYTRSLDKFERVVFIIGGSGIAVPLGYMSMLKTVRRVVIYWAIREEGFVRVVEGRLDGAEVNVFVTGEIRGGDILDGRLADGELVTIRKGRMDVQGMIEDEIDHEEILEGSGRTAVVCCGPKGMAEECREGVRRVVLRGTGRVEYFEESYHW